MTNTPFLNFVLHPTGSVAEIVEEAHKHGWATSFAREDSQNVLALVRQDWYCTVDFTDSGEVIDARIWTSHSGRDSATVASPHYPLADVLSWVTHIDDAATARETDLARRLAHHQNVSTIYRPLEGRVVWLHKDDALQALGVWVGDRWLVNEGHHKRLVAYNDAALPWDQWRELGPSNEPYLAKITAKLILVRADLAEEAKEYPTRYASVEPGWDWAKHELATEEAARESEKED